MNDRLNQLPEHKPLFTFIKQTDEMCSLGEYLVSTPPVLGSLPSPGIVVYTSGELRSTKEG